MLFRHFETKYMAEIEEDNSEFDLTKLVIQLKEEAVYESNGSNVEMWGRC